MWARHCPGEGCYKPPAPLRSCGGWSLAGTSHERNREACPGKDHPFTGLSGMLQPDQDGDVEMAHFDSTLFKCSVSQETDGLLKGRRQKTRDRRRVGGWIRTQRVCEHMLWSLTPLGSNPQHHFAGCVALDQ